MEQSSLSRSNTRTSAYWIWFVPICATFVCLFNLQAIYCQTPIATLNRSEPINFDNEILPLLRKNCLACHSASEANGDLVLESVSGMLKGGDTGPAIVPGKGVESLLLKVAAHQVEPLMPPAGNDVAAKNLTSAELGLLKLWIDQGAKGSAGNLLSPVKWRPLPLGDHPIYTVAVTADGQFAACGRANQILIYHVPTGQLVTRLNDPKLQEQSKDKLPGVAHLDVVQSLSFSRNGDLLASGGFRTVKLWRYPKDVHRFDVNVAAAGRAVAVSPDRKLFAIGAADNSISIWNAADGTLVQKLVGHVGEVTSVCFAKTKPVLISSALDATILVWRLEDGALTGRIDLPTPINSITTFVEPSPMILPEVASGEDDAATAAADVANNVA
ncbi:MAG: WD40 repeat protein, partial [Pirellulaceae bacterium]